MKTTKLLLLIALLSTIAFAADETYVGWVSDSGCALARASAGKYTATNPECARRCVKEGKKIVLISQELKNVFVIENPEALKSEVGNKVRVSASATGKNSLHVNKLMTSEKSNPECERPTLKE
jgi:hypothetical protein